MIQVAWSLGWHNRLTKSNSYRGFAMMCLAQSMVLPWATIVMGLIATTLTLGARTCLYANSLQIKWSAPIEF
jgi:hypothetical protein